MKRTWILLALLVTLVGAASGCGSSARTSQPKTQIAQLQSLDQLRNDFDAYPGVPRLILLISPT
ncbi:MAG TPA: hypothetical protein VFM96_10990 [Gaiellaceae bacterium]|nr:hypothetical protein [Gaiellaceae bacterium]